ncbi:MAG TPA: heat-inducible transcriptional repressor HrcA [Ktedonobacterales bacterium]
MTVEHEPLSARQEAILSALIQEYVRSAEPVASRSLSDQLARTLGPGHSPATIRSELGALEDHGLIVQPHHSAGRVPTDLGYRYFVERLMNETTLSLDEQRLIRHQFYQVQHQLDQWVRLTASVMAIALQSAAVITPPRGPRTRLKHFELLALHDAATLLVLVLEDGTVEQERLYLDTPTSQEELSRLARHFNERYRGADAAALRQDAASDDLSPDEHLVADALARLLDQHARFTYGSFYQDGLTQLLRRDEYTRLGSESARAERIRKVVEALEQNRFLPALAPQVMAAEGVQVIIGAENQTDDLKDMSMVVARYGVEGQVGGLLGVVGPTRMQYGRAIAIVRYMTELLNDLLAEQYGSEQYESDGGMP